MTELAIIDHSTECGIMKVLTEKGGRFDCKGPFNYGRLTIMDCSRKKEKDGKFNYNGLFN